MIAWVDLETTGSDEKAPHASVLEVGVIVTDNDLVEVQSWTGVANPGIDRNRTRFENEYGDTEHWSSDQYIDRLYERCDPIVQKMHDQNGLWTDVRASRSTPYGVDMGLAAMLKTFRMSSEKIALAGSGVGHFDSRWIKLHMPNTAKYLTHWVYDVGVMRRFLRDLSGVNVDQADPAGLSSGEKKTHRALEDARAHLAEARFYRDMLKKALIPTTDAMAAPTPPPVRDFVWDIEQRLRGRRLTKAEANELRSAVEIASREAQ